MFDAVKVKNECVAWIRDFFEKKIADNKMLEYAEKIAKNIVVGLKNYFVSVCS